MAQRGQAAQITDFSASTKDNMSIICTVRHTARYGNASNKLHSGSAFTVTEQ
jgi:hypothetical protein